MDIEIKRIELTGWNPRTEFNEDKMKELQTSIEAVGVLQPIVVRSMPDNKKSGYQLIAGERRFRAAKALGLKTIPAVIKELDDKTAREVMLLENLQREDLTAMEEAKSVKMLLEDGTKQEDLAEKIGKSQSWIANRLRLIAAPEDVQKMIISQEITPKHVMVLLKYEKYKIYKNIMESLKKNVKRHGTVSVRRLEDIVYEQCDSWHVKGKLVFPFTGYAYGDLGDSVSLDEARKAMDKGECEKCSDLHILVDDDGTKEKFCLEPKCFKRKLNEGKVKVMKKKNKAAKTVSGSVIENFRKGKVARSAIPYESRRDLGGYECFDVRKLCKGCEKQVKNPKGEKLCFDPACYDQIVASEKRNQRKVQLEERRRIEDGISAYLKSINVNENEHYRFILTAMVDQQWDTATKGAAKHFGQEKTRSGQEKILRELKGKDVLRGIYAMQIHRIADAYHISYAMDKIKKQMPFLKTFIPRKQTIKKDKPVPLRSPKHKLFFHYVEKADSPVLCGGKMEEGICSDRKKITCPKCLKLMAGTKKKGGK